MKEIEQERWNVMLASPEEVEGVLKLLKDVARWLEAKGEKQWETVLAGEDDEAVIQSIQEGQTYVVKENSHVVATLTLYPDASEWDDMLWGEDKEETIYLHKLAIAPEKIGKGLGNEILTWVEKHLIDKGVSKLRLDCIEDNEHLNVFYSKNGYQKMGVNHGFSLYEKNLLDV